MFNVYIQNMNKISLFINNLFSEGSVYHTYRYFF